MDYHRMNGVNIRIVRIFNTYGPRMHPFDGRVVSELHPPGARRRGHHDLRRRQPDPLVLLSRRPGRGHDPHDERAGDFIGPVNLGNPDEFTIRELAELVIELTGSSSKLVYEPLPADDPTRRQPDITLADSSLHWEPDRSLARGTEQDDRVVSLDRHRALPPADAQLLICHLSGSERRDVCPRGKP